MDTHAPPVGFTRILVLVMAITGACSSNASSAPGDASVDGSVVPVVVDEDPKPAALAEAEPDGLQVEDARGCGHRLDRTVIDEDLLSIRGGDVFAPGDVAEFVWDIDGNVDAWGGTFVQCWNGAGWRNAWGITGTYPQFGEPGYVLDVDHYMPTTETFNETEGRIAIPPGTPPGSYRIVFQIYVCDVGQGGGLANCDSGPFRGGATFEVIAP